MKLFFSLMICFLLTSCTDYSNPVQPSFLFDQIMKNPKVKTQVERKGVLFLAKEHYCASNDCESIFDNPTYEVKAYEFEELFLRKIRTFVIIDEIDEVKQSMTIEVRPKQLNGQHPKQEIISW